MTSILRARSSAKINLTLDITGLLPNGYHELQSIVHTVGIWDDLELEFVNSPQDIFSCSDPELETPENLCQRAVNLWRTSYGTPSATRIHLEKRIPAGAGLGGGSGNAAAVLEMLWSTSGQPCSRADLNAMAAKLGADVPLFLEGGAMLMEGIGDKLTKLSPLSFWVVILKPPFGLSTPQVYRAWDGGNFSSRHDTPPLLQKWPPAADHLASHIGNDLARAAQVLNFDLDTWLTPLQEAGAFASEMTGSGSAVYGLFPDESSARKAEVVTRKILANVTGFEEYQCYCVPLTTRGVEIL